MSDIEYRAMNKATQRSFTQHWLLSARKSAHSPEVKNNLSFARRNERTRRYDVPIVESVEQMFGKAPEGDQGQQNQDTHVDTIRAPGIWN
jgi:hypothetical protein